MEKVTLYGCPGPHCSFTTEDREELQDHVNDEHREEWHTDPRWPDPVDE